MATSNSNYPGYTVAQAPAGDRHVVQQQPSQVPPTPLNNAQRVWSSGYMACMEDEESCWWGTWCCCILSARNAETFSVGSSKIQMLWTVVWIVATILMAFFLLPAAILSLLVGGIVYAYHRTRVRVAIREKYAIFGDSCNDFCMHCFCAQCSVCQEAREAKSLKLKEVDYISGQDMKELVLNSDQPLPTTLQETFYSLSHTSQLLVSIVAVVASVMSIVLLLRKPSYFVVLLVVFLQPALILYFVYWRQRRKFAQLDYVIKLFMVGFFMATTQSIVFEEILQVALGLFALVSYAIFNPPPEGDGTASWSGGNFGNVSAAAHFLGARSTGAEDLWNLMQHVKQSHRPLLHSVLAYEDLVSPYLTPASASSYGMHDLSVLTGTNGTSSNSNANDDNSGFVGGVDPTMLRHNLPLLIIVLLLMAYVVAAGVEETMKHFVVRCCRLPQALKEPQTILVYLMTAALGFATAENIEYVFGTRSSPLPGTSIFVGELFILAIRILMPIHVICAVLQAAELSKNVAQLSIRPLPLWRVLLPAIALHGTFDFFLFLMAALQVVYEIKSVAFDVCTMVVPFLITIAGIVWAYYAFNHVEERFRQDWRPLQDNSISSTNMGHLEAGHHLLGNGPGSPPDGSPRLAAESRRTLQVGGGGGSGRGELHQVELSPFRRDLEGGAVPPHQILQHHQMPPPSHQPQLQQPFTTMTSLHIPPAQQAPHQVPPHIPPPPSPHHQQQQTHLI